MQIATLIGSPSPLDPNAGPFYDYYVNNSGIVIGSLGLDAALWQNGSLTDLGFDGFPLDINASGELSGVGTNFKDANYPQQAFIWKDGVETILPGFSGSVSDYADGLNNLGVVVGHSRNSLGNDQAVMWQNGQLSALAFLPGGSSSGALRINDQGQIIGWSTGADGKTHAVIWQNGTPTDLGSLTSGDYVVAAGINNNGLVVGYEEPNSQGGSTASAWVWQNGAMTELPGLTGYAWTYASAVNDDGTMVGEAVARDYSFSSGSLYLDHAVIWQNGQITDLNSLLPSGSKWVLNDAVSINNKGEIAGSATYDGTKTSFELTLCNGSEPAQIGVGAVTAVAATLTAPVAIIDNAAGIAANLDGLESLAKAGTLAGITLTDSGVPDLTITQAQLAPDADALGDISGAHSVTVRMSGNAGQYDFASGSFAGATALQFSDETVIVAQMPGTATVTSGNVTELYAAVFAREPDVGGLAFYQDYLKANPGTGLAQFAEWFLASPEYTASHAYPQTSAGDQQFIVDFYQNLLHRTPSAAEIAYYQANVMATGGAQAHAQTLVYLSASAEFLSDVQITAAHPADAQHWLLLV